MASTLWSTGVGTGVEATNSDQLITGGLGGLGLLLTCWFAQNEKNMILMDIQYHHTSHAATYSKASSVTIMRGNICTTEDVSYAMKCMQKPPYGILHAAGILQVCTPLLIHAIPRMSILILLYKSQYETFTTFHAYHTFCIVLIT